MLVVLAFLWGFFAYPFSRLGSAVDGVSHVFSRGLDWLIDRIYTPALKKCLSYPVITFSAATACLLLASSLVGNGTVPWIFFPKIDARSIEATVVFPDGTPKDITDAATRKLEAGLLEVAERYEEEGESILELTYRLVGQVSAQSPGGPSQLTTGGHAGTVKASLVENQKRSVSSLKIVEEWREIVGSIPGAESVTFDTLGMGPGGKPIEFKLLANAEHMDELEQAIEACKAKLAEFPGVYDIADDSRPGKWEIQLRVSEKAKSLGVPLEDIAQAVRSAYYGQEVMRLQRGRHEVKLMVRYPEEERRSLARFRELRVDSADGVKRPLTELAEIETQRGYSEINRVDQKRSITVTADLDENKANASAIIGELRSKFMPGLLEQYPHVRVRWEGQAEQTVESVTSLFVGMGLALMATFVLLTVQFKSYYQPLIIMAVIPFGLVGAIMGHAIMGLPLTLFSVLGLVALTGVVVNDSIVLVDFINARVSAGMPLAEALVESGRRRFRPVLLTSLTTIAGLLPILAEKSLQAQILIPMANSICFGLMLSTVLVLFLVPTYYSIYGRLHPELDFHEPAAPASDHTPLSNNGWKDDVSESEPLPVSTS